jgi:hypothetical protein
VTKGEKKQLCAICGREEATTSDHIPPRGIFPKPRPSNLITVPACLDCNHAGSAYEESFRVYLSMEVGSETPETTKLWEESALGTLKHNHKLRREIERSFRFIDVRTPAGIYLGKATSFRINAKAYNAVIERIVRGFYYHHYGEIIGDRAIFKTTMLRGIDRTVLEMSQGWPINVIGKQALIYKFYRVLESPLDSVWIFEFYNHHWAMGSTEPVNVPNNSFMPTPAI